MCVQDLTKAAFRSMQATRSRNVPERKDPVRQTPRRMAYWNGDIYSSDFADQGDYERQDGGVSFSRDGSTTHNTASASNPSGKDKGARFSWNTDEHGSVSKDHFTDRNVTDKGDPDRHPFGR